MGRPSTGKTKQEQKRQDYERHRQAYIDRATAHYEKNGDEIRARTRERESHARHDKLRWPALNAGSVKTRARRKGLPIDFGPEDIPVPDACPVLGIPIILGGGKNKPNAPSVDRIRPELGYVRGNVRVISFRANALKANASVAEMRLVLADMERNCL